MELFWVMTLQWGQLPKTATGTVWVEDVATLHAHRIPDAEDIFEDVFEKALVQLRAPSYAARDDTAVLFYSIEPMDRRKGGMQLV